MDNTTLKKKLSSYVSDKGYLKGVSDDILFELLIAWEHWTGSSKDFYKSLGYTAAQMASLIGKAKKLKREGYFGAGEFKQVAVEAAGQATSIDGPCLAVEIVWKDGRIIRFSGVDYLLDFLKKSA